MSTKLSSWLIFLGCLLTLCLPALDHWFVGLRLAAILLVSFVLVRHRFFARGDVMLYRRLLNWFRDEA